MNQSSWILKYHPTTWEGYIGNKESIQKIHAWFERFQQEDIYPILFLYGNTGIGKTTLAYLFFEHYGYQTYEMNSGDVRSRKRMEDISDKILGHKVMKLSSNQTSMKHMGISQIGLIMDEIDGMSCGDKGGLHYLFEIASNRKNVTSPIICISTKPYEKNGSNDMIEIELVPPTMEELKGHCLQMVMKEHMCVEEEVIERVIVSCKMDIRKTIITLQEIHDFYPDTLITMSHLECIYSTVFQEKDGDMELFRVTERLMTQSMESSQIEYYYQLEPNLMPLMIYENLPYQLMKKKILVHEILPIYEEVLYQYGVLDTIENTVNLHSELERYMCVAKCESVNQILCQYGNKNKEVEKIRFTCSLSKSALISNNLTFMNQFSRNNNLSYYYFPQLFVVMMELLRTKKVNILVFQEWFHINGMDFEKIIQFYQKWCPSVENSSLLYMKKQIKSIT